MKKITLILIALISFYSYGQKVSFSEHEFETLRKKTEDLAKFYPDSAIVFSDKLMVLAKESKSQQHLADAITTKLRADVFSKDALLLNKEALEINIKHRNTKEISTNYTLFGIIYLYKADYTNAVKYLNKSLKISQKNKFHSLTKQNYRALSTLYGLQENYPKALQTVKEALKLEKENPDHREKGLAYICLATYYDYISQKEMSNKYFQLAYNSFKQIKNDYNVAVTLLNWSVLFEESDPIKSLEMELEAQKIFDNIVPKSLYSANNLGNMGSGFFSLAQNDSLLNSISSKLIPKSKSMLLDLSENCFKKSFEILKNNKNAYGLFYMSGSLSELQAFKGNYKNAYKNLLESKKLGDSLFSQKNKNAIAKLESENQVLQLKTINEQKSNLNKILIGSSIALSILGFLGYRNFRNKRKLQNLKITELEKDKQLYAIDAMLKGQEEERSRIAKDLHDGLGGLLSGTKLSFTTMKENLILTPENAIQFDKSLSMLDNTMSDLRKVAHNLMPEALVKFGLNESLKDFCTSIQSTQTVTVIYQKLGSDIKYENTTEVFIYRIIQELVNNALKHSQAKEILVQLATYEKKIHITVEDDGIGYDFTTIKSQKGAGLANIEYRVNYLNGTIDKVSSPNNGTAVNIEFKV